MAFSVFRGFGFQAARSVLKRSKLNRRRRFMRMLKRTVRSYGRGHRTLKTAEVEPQTGCILKCDLGVLLEHTGIYIGKGKIVSLNRHGHIKIETPHSFFPPGTNPDSNKIYTACFADTNGVLCSKEVAKRAKSKIDDHTKYNVLFNNCHRFTAGCITGNYDNHVVSFSQLEEVILLYIELMRPRKSWWRRLADFVLRRKEPVLPSSFNWRPVAFERSGK